MSPDSSTQMDGSLLKDQTSTPEATKSSSPVQTIYGFSVLQVTYYSVPVDKIKDRKQNVSQAAQSPKYLPDQHKVATQFHEHNQRQWKRGCEELMELVHTQCLSVSPPQLHF